MTERDYKRGNDMSNIKTLTCPGPPEHTFKFEQKGRGRPPKFCADHKPVKTQRHLPNANDAINHYEKIEHDIHPQSEVMEEETNPFIKKARSSNPFIAKAESSIEADTAVEDEDKLKKHQQALLDHSQKRAGSKAAKSEHEARPARFERTYFDEEIVDSETYNDAAMPGIKIHDIRRDTSGQWSCQLTVNEETFNLVRRGGWLIAKPDGSGYKEALPHVAAAIQARVNRLDRLEPKVDEDNNRHKKHKRASKTLEQVADEVAPMTHDEAMELVSEAAANDPFEPGGSHEEAHDANMSMLEDGDEDEFKGAVCECCERVQEKSETGWAIIEGIQFCPTCTTALEDDDDESQDDVERGYADLLAKPEQFDGAYADFADTIEAEIR